MRHVGRGGAGLCSYGARQWCAHHRIDFLAFVREGIAVESLQHIQCPLLNRVIEAARQEESRGQQ